MRTSLLVVVIIAIVLRFWQLGVVPPSPDWDEASLGYNAYSILTTGKDEYGKTLPFVLRSFDDYKPALYAYLVIPSIKLFGLTSFAVRLPSAVFGVLTVIATYFLLKELFKNSQLTFEIRNLKLEIPEVAALLLAISPWHIQFSRIAFEANVGLAFNIFAAYFFIKGLKRPWLLIASAILGGLNLYIYQAEKVFTPLLFLLLAVLFRKELFSLPKKFLVSAIVVGFIISLPMMHFVLTNDEALKRAQGVSAFSDKTEFLKNNVSRMVENQKNRDVIGLIFDNRRFIYLKSFLSGYLSHFDLNWLFTRGDISRHHAPGMGLLYLWELPFLLFGIYHLVFGNFERKIKLLVFGWLLITPVAASITMGVPHAIRTLNFLPIFQVLTAIGILFASQKIFNFQFSIFNLKPKYLLIACFLLLITFNVVYYLNQYFAQLNYFTSKDWQYGYKQAVAEIKGIADKYEKIVVSNRPHLDQSYMFFLFYFKYPPSVYQKEAAGSSGGFLETHAFGKFDFRPIDWNNEKKEKRLFVGKPDEFPAAHKGHVKSFYFLNGEEAIRIVEGE